MKKITLTLIVALCVLNVSFGQIFVDDNPSGSGNNGNSWADAYTDLQTAIDEAKITGEQIWVAFGIYRPSKDATGNASPADDKDKTFYIDSDIEIYGNFNGESTLAARNANYSGYNPFGANSSTNRTILSGDLADDDPAGDITTDPTDLYSGLAATTEGDDNAYTVLTVENTTTSCVIDGVLVTAGVAGNFLGSTNQQNGGGAVITSPCTINLFTCLGNFAWTNGAGLHTTAAVSLNSSYFQGNLAYDKGGDIYNTASSTITGTFFAASSALYGGAICNVSTGGLVTPTLVNCVFSNINIETQATNAGSGGNGAAIFNSADGVASFCTPIILNCSFNVCNAVNGGAVYNESLNSGTCTATITNTAFYSITASGSGEVLFNDGSTTNISYSLTQVDITSGNESAGSGTVSPGDGLVVGDAGYTNSVFGNLFPLSNSPLVNAGDNSAVSAVPLDIQLGLRVICGKVDIGAYERSTGKGQPNSGRVIDFDGTTNYVDLGSDLSGEFVGTDFTIETWMYVDNFDATADREVIFSNHDGTNGIVLFVGGENDATNKYKLGFQVGGTTFFSSGVTAPIQEATWHHVAIVFNHSGGNSGTFYVDGESLGSVSFAAVTASSSNAFIGFEAGTSDYTDSKFEEMRIWNDVRTMNEIRKNMRLTLSCGGQGALAFYQFNEDLENALELTDEPDVADGGIKGLYKGTIIGTVTSDTYPGTLIALGSGCSELVNVTGTGTNSVSNVDGLGFSVNFTGTHPNGDIVLTYLEQGFNGAFSLGGNTDLSIDGQFVIDNYGTVTADFDYTATMFLSSSIDLSNGAGNYTLMRRDANAVAAWEYPTAAGADAVDNSSSPKTATFSMTDFGLGQLLPVSGTVVPVELTIFEANLRGKHVYLDWQTASEENNLGFEIEKSVDGREWKNIGFVEGNGTTFEFSNYQFIDENPVVGTNYYRLKQLDTDGKFEYSPIRTANYGDVNSIAIYPNPTKDVLIVNLGNQSADIQVFDLTGRLLINTNSSSNAIQNIDFTNFENGVYILRVNGNGWHKVEKIVVQH